MASLTNQITMLGLSETWLTNGLEQIFSFRGYHHEFSNCLLGKHGGVALLIDSSISYQLRADLKVGAAFCESVFVEISYEYFGEDSLLFKRRNVIVGVDYSLLKAA